MRIGIVSVNLKKNPTLSFSRHPFPQFANCLLVHTLFFFLPVAAGISTMWGHRTVLEPYKWIFNQLHGWILCSSVPFQVQQQNDRDVLSFRYNSSVHCSVQYLQKVYGCCGGFFVTVNLHEPVLTLYLKVENHHLDMIIRTFKISWTFPGKRDDPPWDLVCCVADYLGPGWE